jgi:hypothetical protein
MDTKDPIDIVRHYAAQIQNGRTLFDIHEHGEKEMVELKDELIADLDGGDQGADGIVGEAVDVIACMLDAIFVYRPETTNDEIAAIMLAKCEKWARRYKDSVDGDRSID